MTKNLKLYCDTNGLIDFLCDSRPCFKTVRSLFRYLFVNRIKPYVSSQSIIDAQYSMCSLYKCPLQHFRDSIKALFHDIDIVEIKERDLVVANDSTYPDYEDEAQLACAQRLGCDLIISSNKGLKRHSKIPVYTPREFLAKITGAN